MGAIHYFKRYRHKQQLTPISAEAEEDLLNTLRSLAGLLCITEQSPLGSWGWLFFFFFFFIYLTTGQEITANTEFSQAVMSTFLS